MKILLLCTNHWLASVLVPPYFPSSAVSVVAFSLNPWKSAVITLVVWIKTLNMQFPTQLLLLIKLVIMSEMLWAVALMNLAPSLKLLQLHWLLLLFPPHSIINPLHSGTFYLLQPSALLLAS